MKYFLLDKVTELKLGEYAKGKKAVTLTDPILHDHFPGYPILPGALIIEGLAQLAGVLLEFTFNQSDENIVRAVLVQVDKMKFYQTTGPGEVLEYEATIDSLLEDAARVSVTASIGAEIHAKGRINFQMAQINTKEISQQRQYIYKIWTKGIENCPTIR